MTPPADDIRSAGTFAPALVITGMHRSGTSLASGMLAAAGVHVGRQLMGPATGNPRGHFEDLEFVRVHERLLAANGLSRDGFTCHDSIAVPPTIDAEARALRDRRRREGRLWGWKDPRTTLFLDYWAGQLPEARFLFMVRPPWEVVDSLFRRGDDVFAVHPRLAIDLWVSYNRRILDFVRANADRCVIVDTHRLAADPAGFVTRVGDLLGRRLDHPGDLYEPDLLEMGTSPERRSIVAGAHPDAVRLYTALRALAGTGVEAPGAACKDLADAAFAEWWHGIARSRESLAHEAAALTRLEGRLAADRDRDIAAAHQQAAVVG